MIVVSHRGPYRFEPRGDGSFSTHRSAGGVVSALGAVLDKAGKEATWIAAAFSDDDREAARSGAIEESGIDLRLIAIDPEAHAQHYDVISNGVLWFLFHDLFDRVRRPAFDLRFREAWEAYTNVNAAFAASAAEAAAPDDVVLVHDYQLALAAAQLRELRPDVRVVHFTHTPFCGPDDIHVLPAFAAQALCAAMASNPAGFHSPRQGRRVARL